jgi:hypothetical protein
MDIRRAFKEKYQMTRNTAVMGIYPDRKTVSDAISVLQKAGYRPTDISVLCADNQGSKDFGIEKRAKALEGAAIGAAALAVVGAVLAWLASAQTVNVAWLGAVIAAGPVVAAVAGAGAGGIAGWILGFLIGLGRPEYVAKRYEGRIRRGGILLSVHCDSPEWSGRAQKTLTDTGASHVSAGPESAADFGTTNKPTERAPLPVVERVEMPVLVTPEPVAEETKK